jgi:enoyl-CoA hydratase
VKIEARGSVALLQMNAGKANAMGAEWIAKLDALLDELARSSARAVVLTGYEGFFSAGLELPSLVGLSREDLAAFVERFGAVMLRLFELPRPVVAAINGHAIAGGCVCALQADERLMARGPAKIGLTEVTIGVGLPAGAIEPLRCQVPASALRPIALEGRVFSADEALALGLVHEVVASEDLLTRALARAEELGKIPPLAFAHTKAQIRRPVAEAVRAAMASGDTARWLDVWFSPEAQERLAAAVARLTQKKPR